MVPYTQMYEGWSAASESNDMPGEIPGSSFVPNGENHGEPMPIAPSGSRATDHTPMVHDTFSGKYDMPGQKEATEPHKIIHTRHGAEYRSVTEIEGIRVPVMCNFYDGSHQNNVLIAEVIAPQIMATRSPDEPFRVLDVACSEGRDTWSTASVLALRVPYHIDAIDTNRDMLALTTLPYRATKQELSQDIKRWDVPAAAADFFEEVGTAHIRPTRTLQDSVNFKYMNIAEQAPETDAYDAVIANGLFSHLTSASPQLIDHMLANIAASLRVGGIFTLSDRSAFNKQVLSTELLAQHHLLPSGMRFGEAGSDHEDPLIYIKVAHDDSHPSRLHRAAAAAAAIVKQP